MPVDAINVLGELIAAHDEELEDGEVTDRTLLIFNPGVRVGWNGPASLQLVWGLSFPIGLTRDTDDFGVLLYFSAEHAVTRQAREERRW